MRARDDARRDSAHAAPVLNITCDTTTRSTGRVERAERRRRGSDERQRDAAASRVLAQDDVERIELAARRDHARHGVVRVEDRAQALARARLGNDAIGARGAQQAGETRPIRAHLVEPRVPRAAHVRIPRGEPFAHVVVGRVERTAERMVGEVDAVAPLREHAREERRDVPLHARFRERAVAERRDAALTSVNVVLRASRFEACSCSGAALRAHGLPITVRTSISSGKNGRSSARFR